MERRLRIALMIESSRAYGRRVLQGIGAYASEHGPWAFYYEERETGEAPPSWLKSWRGDGIISRMDDRALVQAISATRVPAVDLRGVIKTRFPVVKTDDRRVVQMALDHLLDRGFSRLAYCGFTNLSYSERRLKHCLQCLRERGLSCSVYQTPPPKPHATQREIERVGVLFSKDLADWLRALPKPVGLLACNDIRGQQVLNACREIGLAVPEEIAVVGVDNEETLCELSDPPMSSVELDTFSTGYEAAALLHRMIRGRRPESPVMTIRPKAVIGRQSTDVLAIADPRVAAAVRYIRLHAVEGLTVQDVASQVPVSRRLLERQFRTCLGRTPHAEIVRVRMQRVRQLLLETCWPLDAIARATGFEGADYLSVAFKRETGSSPGEFRRKRAAP